MESVFIRHSKVVKKSLPKVKSGISGLDNILGGGLIPGTVTLLEADSISKHYISVLRCFFGEGAANKEKLFLYSEKAMPGLVPSIGKKPKQVPDQLRIAWRYDKTPSASEFLQVYDLGKSVNYPVHHAKPLPDLYTQIYTDISASMSSSTDKDHRRIAVLMEIADWDVRELNLFMISLRCLLRSLNASCLICTNLNGIDLKRKNLIKKGADFALAVKEFEGENQFIGYCAMLEVVKPLKLQSLANYDLKAPVYGIIRDNKHIYIENLSLPPAESLQKSTLDY